MYIAIYRYILQYIASRDIRMPAPRRHFTACILHVYNAVYNVAVLQYRVGAGGGEQPGRDDRHYSI